MAVRAWRALLPAGLCTLAGATTRFDQPNGSTRARVDVTG